MIKAITTKTTLSFCSLTSVFVLLSAAGLCSLLHFFAADAAAASPYQTAPVNPEFISWQRKTFTYGADAHDEQGHRLGYTPSPFDWSHLQSQNFKIQQSVGQPAGYDLRSYGYVTDVRDQGNCGSCWTFGTYGPLESWLLKNESETWDFSENHLKNYHGFDLGPCDGGNEDMSTAYLARWSGPVNESDDPYHDWDDRPSPGGPPQKYLECTMRFSTENDIKNAVMSYGALCVALRYESSCYNSSEYTYYYDGSNPTNHAVTLIGWDDNKAVSGAPGNGAWLVKNSWGTDWGDNGYFWISYYDTMAVKYAVTFCDAVGTSFYTTNYQYDPLGQVSGVGVSSETCWGANVFTATGNDALSAVGFYALAENTSYEISIYDNFNGTSFSGLLGSVSGSVSYPGYQTIPLPSPVKLTNGDDFGIVIKFTTPGYYYPVPMEDPWTGYSSGATANPGQSYLSSNGATFDDMTDFFPNSNVCIKGLAYPYGEPPVAEDVNASVTINTPTDIILQGNDDGFPEPLSYIITSLPAAGDLSDPLAGGIIHTPYTLADNGDILTYTPEPNYTGLDEFSYKVTDGGTPPYGGDSNEATVSIKIVIFSDDFPSTTLNSSNWPSKFGSPSVDADAQNEPSPPYSLHLERTESVTSKAIDLSGCPFARLQYLWQRYDTEAGDDLYVDFWDGAGWQELATHFYDEGSTTQFTEEWIPLPADALHQQFRLRFQADCTRFSDEWFIDNVNIDCFDCDMEPPILAEEPDITKGITNAISWSQVEDAAEYFAVCAKDANFSNTAATSGWTNLTDHTFTNLELGCTYFYQVKARTEPDETIWVQTEQAEFEMDTLVDTNTTADGNVVLTGEPDSYVSAGVITSVQIDLPASCQWDTAKFTQTKPDGTEIYIDIIDANDPCEPVVLADIAWGQDLSGLVQTKIKLQASLFTDEPARTPILHDWSVCYVNSATLCQSGFSNKVWSVQCGLDGDFQPDCIVDVNDLERFSMQWFNVDCNDLAGDETDWCSGTDITQNGIVNFDDYVRMAENWMICIGPFCE